MKSIEKCFACRGVLAEERLAYNDIGWTDFKIFRELQLRFCPVCGFGCSEPELSLDVVQHFYEEQYRSRLSTFFVDFDQKYTPGIGDVGESRSFAQLVLARAYCIFREGDVFLDIGPGIGGSFRIAKALFPSPRLFAIELSENSSKYYSTNYGVITFTSIGDFVAHNEPAKFILMSNSLEHYRLSDIDSLFGELKAALADDGVLIIEVPFVDLRVHAEVRGVDTPHFLFFSKESLALIIERAGFDILFMDTCGPVYSHPSEVRRNEASRTEVLKAILKTPYNKLPPMVQIGLRTIVRGVRRVRSLFQKNVKRTTLSIQSYGGDRNGMRVLARKRRP